MTILDRIVLKKQSLLPELRRKAQDAAPRSRPQYSLMQRMIGNPNMAVIAEIKRGSPSLGCFAPNLDPLTLAGTYQDHGASAISILTDEHFFGSLEDLVQVAPHLQLPILAKDFILDEAQIELVHAAGADVILLIAAVLSPERIARLTEAAFQRGMDVILELHELDEIPLTAIPSNVIIGLNNRNLKTFQVSIQNGLRQIDTLKALQAPLIAESGIHTSEDAVRLRDAGFSGMLIGESLIRSSNPSALLQAFSQLPRR